PVYELRDRVADAAGEDGGADQDPGRAAARAREATGHARDPGGEHEPVVEPVDDEVLNRRAEVERELEGGRGDRTRDQDERAGRAPALRQEAHGMSIGSESPVRLTRSG